MNSDLGSAFRFHLQNPQRVLFSDNRLRFPTGFHAMEALLRARADLVAGKTRYAAPIKPFAAFGATDAQGYRWTDNPEKAGLRLVGRVMAECGGRNGYWDKHERSGWYADEDQNNLGYGLVYQLPGRNGESRFVAGYAFRDDEGVTLDLSRVYVERVAEWVDSRWGGYWSYHSDPRDMDAATDAAIAADSMASKAAEEEREYQTAWRAGTIWADLGDDIAATRQEVLGILKERRAAMNNPAITGSGFFALCDAIRARVADLMADISKARGKRAKLAEGEYRDLHFWNGNKTLREAFCDGANISAFPA